MDILLQEEFDGLCRVNAEFNEALSLLAVGHDGALFPV
jgi:hypothetical protein